MRKYLFHIFLLVSAFTFVGCHDDPIPPKEETLLHRTVLVYVVGENSISSDLQSDLEEMVAGSNAIPDSCNVLIYFDGITSPAIYRLTSNGRLEKWYSYSKDQNSCDSLVMHRALKKMVQSFPSSHYGLVLASHASGWIPNKKILRRTFGIDNNSNTGSNNGAEMEIPTLRGILETLPHLDYIFFDACFMQSVETAYELKNVTDWVIASPAEIPGPGAPYHLMMEALCTADVEGIVNGYHSYYPKSVYTGVVLSAVRTDALGELAYHTAPHIVRLFHGKQEYPTADIQSYSPRPDSFTSCYDMNSAMAHLLSPEEYAVWERAFSKAVPYRPQTYSWFSGYNGGMQCRVRDAEHYGAISAYLPSSSSSSAFWNEAFRKTRWYEAAGWDHTGW